MCIAPSRRPGIVLGGVFSFRAVPVGGPELSDSYQLRIEVPPTFPHEIPKVTETGQRIPRDVSYHVNPDGTLCLGSPLRLLEIVRAKANLVSFAMEFLVPYLYAASHRLRHGGSFRFGELAHGPQGVIDDYANLFRLQDRTQVIRVLQLLSKRPRIANRAPCPCGCRRRLGVCAFNASLRRCRGVASRSWFRAHAAELGGSRNEPRHPSRGGAPEPSTRQRPPELTERCR